MGANHNLAKSVEVRRIKVDGTNYTGAAGTSVLTSEAIDTLGYQEVTILEAWGAIVSGAVTTVKVQQSSDDAAADAYDDLLGSSQTVADTDDNKVTITSIYRPAKRYLKVLTNRATQNATVDSIIVILSKPVQVPVTQGATVQGTPEFFNTPLEGTA